MAARGIEFYLEKYPEYGGADVSRALEEVWSITEAGVGEWDGENLGAVFGLDTPDGVLYDMLVNAVEISREHLYTSSTMAREEETVFLLRENLTLLEGFEIYPLVPGLERLAAFSPARRFRWLFDPGRVWGKPFKRNEFVEKFAVFYHSVSWQIKRMRDDSAQSNT